MGEFNKESKIKSMLKSLWLKIKKGFRKVSTKDGFYIILFICICIVGTTAVWMSTNDVEKTESTEAQGNQKNQELEEDIETKTDHEILEELAKLDKLNETKEKNNNQITKDNSSKNKTEEEKKQIIKEEQKIKTSSSEEQKSTVAIQNQSLSMIVPLNGIVTTEFARDRLIYSKTLEQWTTHNGIDISAKKGSVIRATLDGVVKSVKREYNLGIVITIDHGNGLVTKFACVSTDEMVKEGQKVKKGDPISGVGEGVGFEVAQGPHLHFEVLKDGKYVDPQQYLPIIN